MGTNTRKPEYGEVTGPWAYSISALSQLGDQQLNEIKDAAIAVLKKRALDRQAAYARALGDSTA